MQFTTHHTIMATIVQWEGGLLANEKHINGAEVEVVEEGKSSKTIVGGVLARVELDFGDGGQSASRGARGTRRDGATNHDCFPFVLDDVT